MRAPLVLLALGGLLALAASQGGAAARVVPPPPQPPPLTPDQQTTLNKARAVLEKTINRSLTREEIARVQTAIVKMTPAQLQKLRDQLLPKFEAKIDAMTPWQRNALTPDQLRAMAAEIDNLFSGVWL